MTRLKHRHEHKKFKSINYPSPFDVIINHGQTSHPLNQRHNCSICCRAENEFEKEFGGLDNRKIIEKINSDTHYPNNKNIN